MNELSKYLTEQLLLGEDSDNSIQKTIVVYSGRFQPFHVGHYHTYNQLVKKFGKKNVYIGTSNKTDSTKSPFDFKEKSKIISTMFGISKSNIVQIKNPYAPTEILSKFDKNTTAYVTAVGEKDASRLGGKYFKKYDSNIDTGYETRGYVYIVPKQPKAISGTDVRNNLTIGSDEDKKKYFTKTAYPKFNQSIFDLVTSKLEESFVIDKDVIKDWLLKESTVMTTGQADDGPASFVSNYNVFKKLSVKRAEKIGYEVVNMITTKDVEDYYEHPTYPYGPVPAVSYFPAGVLGAMTPNNQVDIYSSKAYSKWFKHITRTATLTGYELIKNQLQRDAMADVAKMAGDDAKGDLFSQEEFEASLSEVIKLPVEIGDTILMGKWKNKKVVVKTIGKDEHGMPTINGKKVVTFRLGKKGPNIFENIVELEEDTLTEGLFSTSLKMKPYEKLIVNSIIEFMKSKYGFDAKIIVKKKEAKGMIGDVVLNDNSLNNNKFYLHFNPSQSITMMIKSLIHELTHVKQISRKELKPSDDYKMILWKNKPIISVSDYKKTMKNFGEYKKLPWESEAYINMAKLYKTFLNSSQWKRLSGDDNIDYIKQNIGESYVLQDLEKKYNIELELYDNGDYLSLDKIIIPKSERGGGVGTKVMDILIKYSDKVKKPIYLTPSNDYGASSVSRLTKFYKNFGFVKNTDKSKTKATMVRVSEMAKADLNKIEKYAEKQLSPEDIEFGKHFFDRLNDKRNGKEISVAELTGFFKRLSKYKKKFKEFLEKYQQLVVKDKRHNINIPFMTQTNQIIAKTIMRKKDFKTSNKVITIERVNFVPDIVKKSKTWYLISKKDVLIISSDVIDLIQTAYKNTKGSYVNSKKDINRSVFWDVIDVDGEFDADAVIFGRKSPFGIKIQGIGHDGEQKSKKVVIAKIVKLLNTSGYWIEASDALENVLYKSGTNYIKSEKIAQSILPNSELKITGNKGQYTRKLETGQTITETIFGKPNISIKEIIKKVDGKFVVYPEKGGKRLGTHDTHDKAKKQLQAIEISKQKNEATLKDYPKEKNKIIIPLGIKTKKSPTESSKLTVGIGLELNKTMKFQKDFFDIVISGGKLYLVITQKGARAIRVRSQKDDNYLDKLLRTFKKSIDTQLTESTDIINEGKQVGIIYHYTDKKGLDGILKSNLIKTSEEYYLGHRLHYVSFTRNKNFHKKGSSFGVKIEYRVTIDGNKLSNRYKINPFAYIPGWNYENSYDYDWLEDESESDVRDFLNATGEYDEQEERITFKKKDKIPNINKYIIKIDNVSDLKNNESADTIDNLYDDIEKSLESFVLRKPLTEGGAYVNESTGLVKCAECNKWFNQIQYRHLKYKHGMTIDEYRVKYPDLPLISESAKNSGDRNPMKDESVKLKHKKICSSDEHKRKLSESGMGKNTGNIRLDNIERNKDPEFRKKISRGVTQSYKNNPKLKEIRSNIGKTYGFGNKKLVESLYDKLGWTRPEDRDPFKLYQELVRRKTDVNYNKHFYLIENAKKRNRDFHLDHKYSIKSGFDNNIPIDVISHYTNLEIINGRVNESKGTSNSITLNELITDIISSNNPLDDRILLQCGGTYGHMNHPFDTDINLTFGQLKDIVNKGLDGELEVTKEKCIAGDSILNTENHGEMTIAELVDNDINDRVLSYNEENNSNEYMDVLGKLNNDTDDEWLQIELDDGKIIEVTPNHRIFVDGDYIEARHLVEGMDLKINT